MNTRVIGQVLLAATVFGVATLVGGWWTLPVLAAIEIAITDSRQGPQPVHLAVAGGLAWLVLLGWRTVTSPVNELAGRLAGLFGQPGWVLPVMTPLFAMVIVWGVATVTATVVRRSKPERIVRPGSAWHS